MNKFNAGDMSCKPSQVWAAARKEGALIQHKDRSGKVVEEFIVTTKADYDELDNIAKLEGCE